MVHLDVNSLGEIVVRYHTRQLILRNSRTQFYYKKYQVRLSTRTNIYHSIMTRIMASFAQSQVILLLSMRSVHSIGIVGSLRTIPQANQQHPIKIKIPTPIRITWKVGSPCSCGM
jgi:hypothetical protein